MYIRACSLVNGCQSLDTTMQNPVMGSPLLLLSFSLALFPQSHCQQFMENKRYEGSSNLVDLQYHMGPVLTSPINLYLIWYGQWNPTHQSIIRDFIHSLSSPAPFPSVSDWWQTIRLYTDQTGSNVTRSITLAGEFEDYGYSHGVYLSRLSMQFVVKNAVVARVGALPLDFRNGLYFVLTSVEVQVQDFCRAVCGFHYFTFTSIVGVTFPYAWVGHSGSQCPGTCAYPFARPNYPRVSGSNQPEYSSRPDPNQAMYHQDSAPNRLEYSSKSSSNQPVYSASSSPNQLQYSRKSDRNQPQYSAEQGLNRPEYYSGPSMGPNGGEGIMGAPNGDVGTDGMVSVIAHELAEASSDPLVNGWYAGNDPTAPDEIADLCIGVYGSGGGGGYVGEVFKDSSGIGYNINGVRGRRYLVQWVWNPVQRRCFGPNAID